MRTAFLSFSLLAAMAFFTAAVGCSESSQTPPARADGAPPSTGHNNHDEHSHPMKGPHGGHIIELGGKGEYHAELVEDEAKEKVTIYILGEQCKNEVPIEQQSIDMNLTIDGTPKTFKLSAVDAANGKASRFDAVDKQLFHALHDHPNAQGRLGLTIAGKPYVGKIEHHEHDHDDHGHDEHGHDGH